MFYFKSIKKISHILLFLFVAVLCSCSQAQQSSLFLDTDTFSNTSANLAHVPLVALNSNAITATITDASKSQYMFFAFPKETIPSEAEVSGASLNLVLEGIAKDSVVTIGFLYGKDFVKQYKLVKELSDRPVITGKIDQLNTKQILKISMGFDNDVQGFLVYCSGTAKLAKVSFEEKKYGWEKTDTGFWYGFSAQGGKLPTESEANNKGGTIFDFTNCSTKNMIYKIKLTNEKSDLGSVNAQDRCILNFGTDTINIRRAPNQTYVTLYPELLAKKDSSVTANTNGSMLTGLILTVDKNNTYNNTEHVLKPVVADPGIIVNWPQNLWRYDGYEVFQWEQFPDILIFDTQDYATQSKMFKRLAFYLEKKGYTGTIWPDKIIATEHGFNAHDYQAEDLASFFSKAEKESFPLNDYELQLKDILFQGGILQRDEQHTIVAGLGAIASVSREIPSYLRVKLLCHEMLHGLYFTQEEYRNIVGKVFASTDTKSLQFLIRYWETNPSLGYDTTNMFLVQNEFMAYMVQQSVESIPQYFADNIANWKSSIRNIPELAKYIRDTRATAFVTAASDIQDYLFNTWGFAAGRVSLVYLN
jgi:hypothetical protein